MCGRERYNSHKHVQIKSMLYSSVNCMVLPNNISLLSHPPPPPPLPPPRPELSLTCGTDVIQESVVFIRSELGTREDDSVEGNVVLGHELVELNLLGILPPFLPVFCVAGRD